MKRRRPLPDPREVKPGDPLRLDVAAALAYPDGSMTASGLRREAARGRLAIERVAGKDYTTLAAIGEMRALCRVEARGRVYGYAGPNMTRADDRLMPPSGSSRTVDTAKARDAASMIVNELKQRSPATSGESILQTRKRGSVHPLTSRLPTS